MNFLFPVFSALKHKISSPSPIIMLNHIDEITWLLVSYFHVLFLVAYAGRSFDARDPRYKLLNEGWPWCKQIVNIVIATTAFTFIKHKIFLPRGLLLPPNKWREPGGANRSMPIWSPPSPLL